MADIVVVGSLNIDLMTQVSRMPKPGETIAGQDLHISSGGKGANQAAAAAKLGVKTALVGCVGDDPFGTTIINELKSIGVEMSGVRAISDTATGTALILVDRGGENCIVISAGANGKIGTLDIDKARSLLKQARLILMQLEIPFEIIEYVTQLAADMSIPVILNPAPARPLPCAVLERIAYLICNEIEAEMLTGQAVKDLASATKAAMSLHKSGVPTVIITLGEKGALVSSDKIVEYIPAKKVEARDTTAAGDAFIGGFAFALVQNCPLKEAVQYGVDAGSLAVTKFGAQPSLPTHDDLETFRAL